MRRGESCWDDDHERGGFGRPARSRFPISVIVAAVLIVLIPFAVGVWLLLSGDTEQPPPEPNKPMFSSSAWVNRQS